MFVIKRLYKRKQGKVKVGQIEDDTLVKDIKLQTRNNLQTGIVMPQIKEKKIHPKSIWSSRVCSTLSCILG